MMSTENVEIEIDISSDFWDAAPRTKIWLDDTVLLQSTVITEPTKVKFAGTLAEGEHELRIMLGGKDGKSQTIMQDGKIIKDQVLNIDGINFDGIDLGFLVNKLGVYETEDGSTLEGVVNLGVNGVWKLKFNAPIYLWLLEHL